MAAPIRKPDEPAGPGAMYVATDSFTTTVDGVLTAFVRGVTRVREGHPVLAGRERLFTRLDPHHEWPAPGRSGETRG